MLKKYLLQIMRILIVMFKDKNLFITGGTGSIGNSICHYFKNNGCKDIYASTTNLEKIVETIETYGNDEILCVMSTTSCFAPRACDNVEEISKICKKYEIGHIINNVSRIII